MYAVESGEHFEDWYVACNKSESFSTFDDAVRSLVNNCMNVINDISSGVGIDDYIAANHQGEDPGWDSEYSKGFWFVIEIDDRQVLHLHLDYELETRSISNDVSAEVNEDELMPCEITNINQSLLKIKEGLTRRSSGRLKAAAELER